MIKKETEKILKYKDLLIKIQRMWDAKTIVIQVIIWRLEPFQNSLRPYLSNIPGKHEIKEL